MIKKHTHKNISWLEIDNPDKQDIKEIISEYKIDPSIASEIELPTYKEKIILSKNYIYMVMHFPALRHSHKKSEQEIDFIIGKDFIITTKYEPIDALEKFSQTFAVNEILDRNLMEDHAGFVFYYILKELYKSLSDELDSINDNLKLIEKNVFNNKEKEMVAEISRANRDLMKIEHAVNSHGELLESAKKEMLKFFGKDFADNLDKISNEYYRVKKALSNSLDFLREIRDTNDSLLSSKQNEIMKILTIITFFSLPFSVTTDLIFQENLLETPLSLFLKQNHLLIIGLQLIVFLGVFYVAKKKKWF